MHIRTGRSLLAAISFAVFALSGCSGGKSHNQTTSSWSCPTSPTDNSFLTGLGNVQVHFPPAVSSTGADHIVVRGIVKDATQLADVLVNNVPVTRDSGLGVWSINVPLVEGDNTVTITSKDSMGASSTVNSVKVKRTTDIVSPKTIAVDEANQRLLFLDAATNTISSMDLSTKQVRRFSPAQGAENLLVKPRGFVLDTANNRLLAFQEEVNELDTTVPDAPVVKVTVPPYIAIDLTSGMQSVFTTTAPTGIYMANSPSTMVVDGNFAYVGDLEFIYTDSTGKRIPKDANLVPSKGSIITKLDLTTGVAQVLSNYDTPNNTVALFGIVGLAENVEGDYLYAFDFSGASYGFLKIKKADGTRTRIGLNTTIEPVPLTKKTRPECSDSLTVTIPIPKELTLDKKNGRLLFISGGEIIDGRKAINNREIYAINLTPEDATTPNTLRVSAAISDFYCSFPEGKVPTASKYPFRKIDTLAMDSTGNTLYTADDGLDSLLAINTETVARTWLAGSGGDDPGGVKSFSAPSCIALAEKTQNVVVCDSSISSLFNYDLKTGVKTVVAHNTETTDSTKAQLLLPLGAAYCPSNNSFLVLDNANQFETSAPSKKWPRLLSLDSTGKLEIAYAFNNARPILTDIALNPKDNIVYVADSRSIPNGAEEIVDGNQITQLSFGENGVVSKVLSSQTIPNNDFPLKALKSIDIDYQHKRILALDAEIDGIIAVDMSTGARTALSTYSVPVSGGPVLKTPKALVVDAANNRALVLDSALNAIVSVDLETGKRTIVYQAQNGDANTMFTARDIALHPFGYVLVIDDTRDTLMAIDLKTQQLINLAR